MSDPTKTEIIGVLYVVATPIGNREDITLRALNILREVDLIAAEDTRKSGSLLAHYQIKNRLVSFHEHNEKKRTPELIGKLLDGMTIALVSNAGTPTVSDPGYILLQKALEHNIQVVPVPGPSAMLAALSISGLPTDSFIFIGFCAKKKTKRLKQLQALAHETRTLIFYESPGRIVTFMNEIKTVLGDRHVVLCREMTKLHEEFLRGCLSEVIETLSGRPAVKGECTLLVKGFEENISVSQDVVRAELIQALDKKKEKLSQICRILAQKYGLSRNDVYEQALKLKSEGFKKE